jgi:hypothetical protein
MCKVLMEELTMKKLIVFIMVLAICGMTRAELLTSNRGFENGDTSDWMQWASGSGTGGWQSWLDTFTINSGGAYEGTYYAEITQSGSENWGYNVAWQGEATTVSAGAGSLTMSAWVRSNDVPDPILKLEYYDPCDVKISEEVTHNAITMDGTWQQISNVFTAPVGTDHVRAVIGWDLAATTGGSFSVHYDAVSLVPEPMSIALFGLGGALVLRRRRK